MSRNLYTDEQGLTDLTPGADGAGTGSAVAINDAGQVLGGDEQGVFLQTEGTRQYLGTPADYSQVVVYDVNDAGTVVARVRRNNTSSARAIAQYVQGQGWQILAPATSGSQPWAINNAGAIVGTIEPGSGASYGFLYTAELGFQNLNNLINAPDEWGILDAHDINEAGQIVGYANNRLTGDSHAVRLTPTVAADGEFTVNSTTDAPDALPGDGACATEAGNCTLRAAVQEANDLVGNDIIHVPGGTYELSLVGEREEDAATGDLDLLRDTIILEGDPANPATIDGNGTDRILDIYDDATVALSNLTLRNGFVSEEDGSAIRNVGTLSLQDMAVTENTVVDGSGALYDANSNFDSPPTLVLARVTVSDNIQQGFGFGAGVTSVFWGGLRIEDSTFTGNRAEDYGAALFAEGGSLVVTNSLFQDNHITGTPEPKSIEGAGGAMHIYSPATIFDSEIISNTATAYGGGIFSRGVMTLTQTLVEGNQAPYGGGVYNAQGYTIADTSVISDNVATSAMLIGGDDAGFGGGGIENTGVFTMTNSTVSGNSTVGNGGGIVSSGTLTVTNSTISSNRAAGDGGGIFSRQIYTSELPWFGISSLNNVTVAGNTADSDGDGTGDGGGIANTEDEVEIWNTIVGSNIDLGGEFPDCHGTFTSLGNNLLEDPTGCTLEGDTESNITGQNPVLGPLQENGGATLTHALLPSSPALDRGLTNCPNPFRDQRAVQRPLDSNGDGVAACDMGAFEAPAPEVPTAIGVLDDLTALPISNNLFGGLALLAVTGVIMLVGGRWRFAARA